MGRNRKEAGKHKKATRRRRQEFARINDLYFEDRQPKDVGLPAPDDAGIIAMATVLTLATHKRLRRPKMEGDSGSKDGKRNK